MSTIPVISLDVSTEGQVLFERGATVPNDLWVSVSRWWLDGNTSSNSFVVSMEMFLQRREWLKTWVRDGGKVEHTPELSQAVRSAHSELEDFKQTLQGNYPLKEVDFQALGLKRSLTPSQVDSVNRLVSIKAGANFSVPGAGKTTVTLVVWEALRASGLVERLLVVCPRSAFEAWKKEPQAVFKEGRRVEIFDGAFVEIDTQVLVVNYEQLENPTKLNLLSSWVANQSAMIVLDEAHRVKGGGASVRWKACRELVSGAKRVDLLTGTPMPQGYEDLRNLFGISWRNIPRAFLSDERLRSIPQNSIFVRTTKDELGLPPLTIQEVVVPMGDLQAEVYSALARSYLGKFILSEAEESYFGSKGRAVMTLLAAATNPGLLNGIQREDSYLGLEWPPRDISLSRSLYEAVENFASHEMPAKYLWVRQYCEKAHAEGRKVLIWSNLVGNLRALQRVLKPMSPALVYGSVSQEDRQTEIDRFRHEQTCGVLLTNPQTLGEGVSLHHHCHEAIYLDRSYNAGHYLQSLDRIHRLGLPPEQPTKIFILQAARTIDQRVAPRLESKVERLAQALNDRSLSQNSLPNEFGESPVELMGINEYDLNDLFTHLRSYE